MTDAHYGLLYGVRPSFIILCGYSMRPQVLVMTGLFVVFVPTIAQASKARGGGPDAWAQGYQLRYPGVAASQMSSLDLLLDCVLSSDVFHCSFTISKSNPPRLPL